jgi:hypothetical protein
MARAKMRQILRAGVAVTTMLFAAHAAAQGDILARPASCAALATVQLNDCTVVNVFRCDEPKSSFFRYEGYDPDGIELINHMNLSYGMMMASDPMGDFVMTRTKDLIAEPTLSEVFSNGTTPFSYIGDVSLFGLKRPMATEGTYIAVEDEAVVSGHTFRQIRSELVMQLPPPAGNVSGWYTIYVSDSLGLVFEGEGELEIGGTSELLPSSPASVALPGEPGFGTTVPVSGCGELSEISDPSNAILRG